MALPLHPEHRTLPMLVLRAPACCPSWRRSRDNGYDTSMDDLHRRAR